MADQCGKCINLDWKNKESYSSVERYYCEEKKRYVEPRDSSCYYFIEDKSKQNNDGGYTPSGCYITTIVCDILGYEDDCELLSVLRNFRDNYLKIHIEYLPLLLEYDKIGPLICNEIKKEKNNSSFCLGLLKYFLIPCANLIEAEKYEEAINVYINMVTYLNDTFDLPTVMINVNEPYDINIVGKGRIRKPKTSEI